MSQFNLTFHWSATEIEPRPVDLHTTIHCQILLAADDDANFVRRITKETSGGEGIKTNKATLLQLI